MIEAQSHDNRGNRGIGYVYFGDPDDKQKRVAWSANGGVIGDADGNWGDITEDHVLAAEEYLTFKGLLA